MTTHVDVSSGRTKAVMTTAGKEFYTMLTQHRVLEHTYNNLEESVKSSNIVFYYLSRTLVEAQLHEMLSVFGDVPFNGAGTLWRDGDYNAAKIKCVL